MLNALTGKGLQNRKQKGSGLQNRGYNPLVPYIPPRHIQGDGIMDHIGSPPPFYGSWEDQYGMGVKKKKGVGTPRKKLPIQLSASSRSNILKPTFINIPISNFDIINWVRYLRIKNFNGVLSLDKIDGQTKKGYYIMNLDDGKGPGTHWVGLKISPKIIEYFDSFGLNCPMEVISLSNKLKSNYIYNSTQYQDLKSVLCGYY